MGGGGILNDSGKKLRISSFFRAKNPWYLFPRFPISFLALGLLHIFEIIARLPLTLWLLISHGNKLRERKRRRIGKRVCVCFSQFPTSRKKQRRRGTLLCNSLVKDLISGFGRRCCCFEKERRENLFQNLKCYRKNTKEIKRLFLLSS